MSSDKRKKQLQEYRFFSSTDDAATVERIDLSNLCGAEAAEEADLIDLNRVVVIKHPEPGGHWLWIPSGTGQDLHWVYDQSRWHELPSYRTITGERVVPTRINHLLSQNPVEKVGTYTYITDTDKSKSYSPEYRKISTTPDTEGWDEGYYKGQANKNLAAFLASTNTSDTSGFFVVDSTSLHRQKFRCPRDVPGSREDGRVVEYVSPWLDDDVLLYVNPANNQLSWYCGKCNSAKEPDDPPITHQVPRWLRDQLAEDGLVPGNKTDDQKSRVPELEELVKRQPGLTYAVIDRDLRLPKGTAARLCKTAKVKVKKKGSRCQVYPVKDSN